MLGLALLGLAVSTYLTWLHYSGSLAFCIGAGGCEIVQTSRYATIGGVPVALLGVLAFLVLAGASASRVRFGSRTPRAMLLVTFGTALSGTLFAAYLTYLEHFVIGAVCPWCLVVALCLTALLILSLLELSTDPRLARG